MTVETNALHRRDQARTAPASQHLVWVGLGLFARLAQDGLAKAFVLQKARHARPVRLWRHGLAASPAQLRQRDLILQQSLGELEIAPRNAAGLLPSTRRSPSRDLRCFVVLKAPRQTIQPLARGLVDGYPLKIVPLQMMMKPGIGAYDRFKELFDRYSAEAGKEQYLIPYFIAAHPGTTDEDMLNLALWLKKNNFRPDQVQAFLPSPMASATAMYHTGYSPLSPLKLGRRVTRVPT